MSISSRIKPTWATSPRRRPIDLRHRYLTDEPRSFTLFDEMKQQRTIIHRIEWGLFALTILALFFRLSIMPLLVNEPPLFNTDNQITSSAEPSDFFGGATWFLVKPVKKPQKKISAHADSAESSVPFVMVLLALNCPFCGYFKRPIDRKSRKSKPKPP